MLILLIPIALAYNLPTEADGAYIVLPLDTDSNDIILNQSSGGATNFIELGSGSANFSMDQTRDGNGAYYITASSPNGLGNASSFDVYLNETGGGACFSLYVTDFNTGAYLWNNLNYAGLSGQTDIFRSDGNGGYIWRRENSPDGAPLESTIGAIHQDNMFQDQWNTLCFSFNTTSQQFWINPNVTAVGDTVAADANFMSAHPRRAAYTILGCKNTANASSACHTGWIDAVVMFNHELSQHDVETYHAGNYSVASTINIGNGFPENNTFYNNQNLNLNASVNSTDTFNATLYINGVANKTQSYTSDDDRVDFNVTFPEGTYIFRIDANQTTVGDSTEDNTFTVDVTNPLITWTVPLNDNTTLIGAASVLDSSINIFNTNLEFFNYNLTNNTGGVFYTNSSTLNNVTSYTVLDAVLLIGGDGVYTASMYVCDFGMNCVLEERTFTYDTTPPSVNNTFPVNNSLSEISDVSFSFVTSEAGTCSLVFDGIVNRTITNASTGSNTFAPDVTFGYNQSLQWNVNCTDTASNTGESGAYNLTLTIIEVQPTVIAGEFLDAYVCPDDQLSQAFLFSFIGFFLLALLVIVEIFFGAIPFFHILIGLALIFFGITMVGCNTFIGGTVILFGFATMVVKVFLMK